MIRTPKVVKYQGRNYYKELRTYKYHTRPFTGYFGGYWTWEYNENDELTKKWMFQVVELAEWQVENAMEFMLNRFKVKYY